MCAYNLFVYYPSDMAGIGIPGKKSRLIIERNSRSISSGHNAGLYGVCLLGGSGAKIYDVDGNSYIDFLSGASAVTLGYANQEIIEIYRTQAVQMHHSCYPYCPSSPAVRFAEELIAAFPDSRPLARKVLFGLSGSQVNHAALLCARRFTGRNKIISFKNTWHGSSGLAEEVTYFGRVVDPKAKDGEVIYLDFPSTPARYKKTLAATTDLLKHHDVAAIILECVQGDGGNVVPLPGALEALTELARAHGAIVIVDEVQSGNGRSGKYWEVEYFNILPDIITAAKGITSGYYPLAVAIGRADVLEALPRLAHLNTFTANPVACEIGSYVLRTISQPDFLRHVNEMSLLLRAGITKLIKKYPLFKEVRGFGLHLGLEMKPSASIDAALFGFLCLQYGLFVGYFGLHKEVLRLHPPLIITAAEIKQALQIMEFCAKKVVSGKIKDTTMQAYREFAVGLSGRSTEASF